MNLETQDVNRDQVVEWAANAKINPRTFALILMQQMRLEGEVDPLNRDWWGQFCSELGPDWTDRLAYYATAMKEWEVFEDDIEPFPDVEILKDGRPLPRTPMNIEYAIAQLRDEMASLIGEVTAKKCLIALTDVLAA